jgi:branched-chain amino acid transport system permease protein
MFAGATTVVCRSRTSRTEAAASPAHVEPTFGARERPPCRDGGGRHRLLPLRRDRRAILFVVALFHVATQARPAWASIRESEPAALAAGVNITLYKLWAFALASFVTGVAGCLLAALNGVLARDQLPDAGLADAGRDHADRRHLQPLGRDRRRVFNQLLPFLFQAQWSVNPNFLLVVFGAGLLQVLLTRPGGLIEQFPKDMAISDG